MMAQDSLFVPCQHLRTNCTSVAETYVHMTLVNRKRQFFVLFFSQKQVYGRKWKQYIC